MDGRLELYGADTGYVLIVLGVFVHDVFNRYRSSLVAVRDHAPTAPQTFRDNAADMQQPCGIAFQPVGESAAGAWGVGGGRVRMPSTVSAAAA